MKTAIKKLLEELQNGFLENKFNNSSDILFLCVKYQELEKQQIIDAYDLGMGHYGDANRRSDAEQYFNETYSEQ